MTPTLLAGASPSLQDSPLRGQINPTRPSGISRDIPVLINFVSDGFMVSSSLILAYRSAPAAKLLPYVGIIASSDRQRPEVDYHTFTAFR